MIFTPHPGDPGWLDGSIGQYRKGVRPRFAAAPRRASIDELADSYGRHEARAVVVSWYPENRDPRSHP